MEDDLGLLRDYSHWILSSLLVAYGILISYLSHFYGEDHE
jgi:hypothetical protein